MLALAEHLHMEFAGGNMSAFFRIFESYRDPDKQAAAYSRGTSKAKPWQSPHQFGLACDFVPFDPQENRWYWPEADNPVWNQLDEAVKLWPCLVRPIAWDRPHVQYKNWDKIRAAL